MTDAAWLMDAAPHLHFEEQLDHYLNLDDSAGVRNLLTVAAPLAAIPSYLQQWYRYAQCYLAGRNGADLPAVIATLETLQQEADLAPRLRARLLSALGIVYEMNEQWDRALHYHYQSVAAYEVEANPLRLGNALCNLAIVYWKTVDYPAAIACAERSVRLLAAAAGHEALVGLSSAWNILGFSQMKAGQWQPARHACEQALRFCQQTDDHFNEGFVCNNLGQICQQLQENDQAEAYYLRARHLTLATENRREAGEVTHHLALLKLQSGAPATAVQPLLDEALTLAHSTNNHEIITNIFLARADLQERQGQWTAALQENREATRTVETLRANIAIPDVRIRLQGSRIEAYEQMVSRLCRSPAGYAEAFHYVEMCKSRVLTEMLANRPLRPSHRVAHHWLDKEAALRAELQTLYQNPSDQHNPALARYEAELHQVRERIQLQDAEYSSFQTVNPLTLPVVQARLPADGVLVEYFTIGQEILAFVITASTIDVVRLPLRMKELAQSFRRLGDSHFGPLQNLTPTPQGRLRPPWILGKLFELLIEPLGAVVQQAGVLCIAPHGLLHYIPFHALYRPTAAGIRYLTEHEAGPRPIIYTPSATTLFDYCWQKPRSTQSGCLAFGYNHHDLHHAEAEAESITQQVGGKSYCGATATRATLLAEGAHYRYLHLSCHGRFNPTWPLSSNLLLADGALDVVDILRDLQLDADLVCLSACETGRSHILRGDELIGLTRAFLYAGTPSLVVSQWLADELSTCLFMQRFYQVLTRPETIATVGTAALALAAAQHYLRTLSYHTLRHLVLAMSDSPEHGLETLQALSTAAGVGALSMLRGDECLLAHPYYWASFFLVGERLAPS